jgi:hypothetical protein
MSMYNLDRGVQVFNVYATNSDSLHWGFSAYKTSATVFNFFFWGLSAFKTSATVIKKKDIGNRLIKIKLSRFKFGILNYRNIKIYIFFLDRMILTENPLIS